MSNRVIETKELSPDPAGASLSPRWSSHRNPPPGSGLSQSLEEGPRAGRGTQPSGVLHWSQSPPKVRDAGTWTASHAVTAGLSHPELGARAMGPQRCPEPTDFMDQHGLEQSSSHRPGRACGGHSRATSQSAKIRPCPNLGEGSPPPCKRSDDWRRGPFLTRAQDAPVRHRFHSRSRRVSLPVIADVGGLGESFPYCSLLIIKTHTYYRRCRKIQRTPRSPIVPGKLGLRHSLVARRARALCPQAAPPQAFRESSRAPRSGLPDVPWAAFAARSQPPPAEVCAPRRAGNAGLACHVAAVTGATSKPGCAPTCCWACY